MSDKKTILVLPGDGIGPEVMEQVKRVMTWLERHRDCAFNIETGLIGGCSIESHNVPLTEETMAMALEADAVLLGAVGGPQWDSRPFEQKPERGLLRLRKEMKLFANLRPAMVFDALAEASTLRSELVSGLDIMIVRELTGGIYFGEPRGIETLPDGTRRGINTQVYTDQEIRRVAKVAFELAQKRHSRLTSVEKANVMESGVLWREEVTKMGATEYSNVNLSHMYADNCAMQLVREPKQFDVILTDNLFGDLLSDTAAMLTGSLGMLPSASLGAPNDKGERKALYEPVHGSAPNIVGKDIANPLAMILSFAMMLRYSFGLNEEANIIEDAIKGVLDGGMRTGDIMSQGKARVSTSVMGDTILRQMDKVLEKHVD